MTDNNYDIQPKYFYNVYFCGGPFLWRPLGTCPVCPVLNPALTIMRDIDKSYACGGPVKNHTVLHAANGAKVHSEYKVGLINQLHISFSISSRACLPSTLYKRRSRIIMAMRRSGDTALQNRKTCRLDAIGCYLRCRCTIPVVTCIFHEIEVRICLNTAGTDEQNRT